MKKILKLKSVFLLLSILFLFFGISKKILFSYDDSNPFNESGVDGDSIDVPTGKGGHLLIDGFFKEDEWKDANQMKFDNKITLYFKNDSGYLYIGVKCRKVPYPYIDLYLSDGIDIYNFHSSGSLGERKINKNEEFKWGFISQWRANLIRSDRQLREKMIKNGICRNKAMRDTEVLLDGFEFQFQISKFKSKNLSFRVVVSKRIQLPNDPAGPVFIFPEDTAEKDTSNWLKLLMK